MNAQPCTKVQIAERLEVLQSHLLIVHPRCTNFVPELSTYRWQKNRNDNIIPVPVDENNHLLDSLAYALAGELKSRPVVGYEQLRNTFQ